jgi:hypothetical protein
MGFFFGGGGEGGRYDSPVDSDPRRNGRDRENSIIIALRLTESKKCNQNKIKMFLMIWARTQSFPQTRVI